MNVKDKNEAIEKIKNLETLNIKNWLNPENKRQAELNTLALVTLIVNGANAVECE